MDDERKEKSTRRRYIYLFVSIYIYIRITWRCQVRVLIVGPILTGLPRHLVASFETLFVYIGRSSDFRYGFVCPQSFAAVHRGWTGWHTAMRFSCCETLGPQLRRRDSTRQALHMPHLHFEITAPDNYRPKMYCLSLSPETTRLVACAISTNSDPDSFLHIFVSLSLFVRMMFRNRKEEKKNSTKNLISLRICFASKIRKQLKYKLETSTIENGIEKGKNIKA